MKALASLIAGIALVAAGGCAAFARGKPIVYWDPKTTPATSRLLVVEAAVNDTGGTLDPDVASRVTERIRSRLLERGLLGNEGKDSPGDAIAVRTSVVAYEAGSAVQRWAAPGWGTTLCTIRTTLVDPKTGETLGDIVVDKSVGAGGFYTVGADSWILEAAADEIADEIARKLASQP